MLSSRIEGTRASLSDVLLDEVHAGERAEASQEDLQEVLNYVAALEYGLQQIGAGRPLTLNMVKEMHGILMRQVRGELSSPGRFRAIQNWIGPARSTVETAVFVPPPPELLMACLTDWERFVHVRGELPDLIQCAILHEQFEAIHPFIEGNGRIGRLLVTLFLIERERLSQPLLYLSASIDPHKQDDLDLLQRVRTHGDWTSWIVFLLDGVEQTAREAVRQTMRLIDLREDFRVQLLEKPRALALVDHLFVNPSITVPRARRILRRSDPSARAAVLMLEERSIVTEITGRSWRRLYLCRPVLEAIGGSA